MGILTDSYGKKLDPKTAEKLLSEKARKIVDKGADISNTDIYNLCLLNKERDEIEEATKIKMSN